MRLAIAPRRLRSPFNNIGFIVTVGWSTVSSDIPSATGPVHELNEAQSSTQKGSRIGRGTSIACASPGTMQVGEVPASDGPRAYKVTPKLDQSDMYDKVFSDLRNGQCLGIFPEGGSHDRTDLLPLKAGVAIIALEAYSKHYITVPIVPVGLNYFQGHRFGGRVVIEFGPPIVVPEQIHLQHETDKRGATDALLKLVTVGMRSCIVPTSNFQMLQQIYTLRRLYVPDGLKLSAEQTMDLNQRIAVGIQRILEMRQKAARMSSR